MNTFIFSAHSVTGLRSANEDRYLIDEIDDMVIVAVFDGHGGEESAGLAKQLLVIELTQYSPGQNLPDSLRQTFQRIDTLIAEKKVEGGTTATVAIIDDDLLTLAYVGDSRAVLFRGGQAVFETRPHVLTDPNELSKYRSSEWFRTKSRLVSQGKIKGFKLSAVSRSLGDTFFEDALSPIPDVTEQKLISGDTLIIATDGLWNFMSSEKVAKIITAYPQEKNISEKLVKHALQSGSTDNVSVVSLFFS